MYTYGSKIKVPWSTSRRRKLLDDKVLEEWRAAGEKLIPRDPLRGGKRVKTSQRRAHPRGSLVRPVPWNPPVSSSWSTVPPPLLPTLAALFTEEPRRSPWLVSRYLDRCFRVTPAPASELRRCPCLPWRLSGPPSAPEQVLGKYASPPIEISSRRCGIIYGALDSRLNTFLFRFIPGDYGTLREKIFNFSVANFLCRRFKIQKLQNHD